MTGRLAVCAPIVGAPSETFIRRHVQELLPGGTVVIARRPAPDGPGTWRTDLPTLWLDELADEWGGERERAAVGEFLVTHGVTSVLAEYLDIWLPFLTTFTRHGARCVAHAHGYDVSSRLRDGYWRAEYLAYREAAAVVTPSQVIRDRLVELGLTPDRVHVVPYGVDEGAQVTRAPRTQVQVLAVGRLVPKKNPVATVEACVRAAARGADLRVQVVGDGPLADEVRAAVTDVGADVELLGARPHDEVLAAMRAADIFCQHSVVDPATGDEEGVPVAILEAMAHGLPVVSTRHAGIPEAVDDGVTGYLVDEGDVEAMADAVATLAADAGLRERLGAAGRARIRTHFSWPREREALLGLLGLG